MSPMTFHQTFEVISEESAGDGDVEESGFDWQDMPYTFKELVQLLEGSYGGCEPSEYPSKNPRWVTMYEGMDMHTGDYRNTSLHPANDRAKRWWPLALKAAGICQ